MESRNGFFFKSLKWGLCEFFFYTNTPSFNKIGSKNGNYSYNAGAGQNIINNTTTFTFTVNGEDYSSSYGGIIFDLDNNKSYFSLGTTGSASDWVAVIARAPSGSMISTLNMDNSGVAPVNNWYTTNPAQRSGKNFSEGVTAVAIMPTGSILSASVEDLNRATN